MKITPFAVSLACLTIGSTSAFAPQNQSGRNSPSALFSSTTDEASADAKTDVSKNERPLLIRAALGEEVERTPVWMMRQAGRHMQCYRDLCKDYPTFRQRSETPEVSAEISLQPYRKYNTDGCIIFSDILTPLPGMGVDFDIDDKVGPVVEPIRSWDSFKKMHAIDPSASTSSFVGETLEMLKNEISPETALLGFIGCPFTLATYLVEGKTSKEYLEIKKMAMSEPKLLHAILQHLAENLAEYALYQVEHGAQLIQIFDSWAGHLSAEDYDTFAAPYQKFILNKIKEKHPDLPTVIYIKHSGSLIERMAGTGVDVVSLDWTVDMAEGRERINAGRAAAGFEGPGGVQGNLDPSALFGPHEEIKRRAEDILRKAGKRGHVMNLGHGIEAATSEESAQFFIETVRNFRHDD